MVIAIIGVLSAIVLSALDISRSKARDAYRSEEIHQIEVALHSYFADNGAYPNISYDASANFWTGLQPYLVPAYINSIPLDPTNSASGTYFFYVYNVSSSWISTNPWSYLGASCAGHTVLVAHMFENSSTHRQDCAMTSTNAESIVLQ